jgi:predicted HNH restriction endonuclease
MVATKEEFIKALLKVRDNGKIRNTKFLDMLRAQYSAENHTITATRLAEAAGYENYNAANLQYGTLGHEIADVLNYEPPKRKNGEPMWFWTISSGKDASEKNIDGHYEFIMRPELVAALEEMKWVK